MNAPGAALGSTCVNLGMDCYTCDDCPVLNKNSPYLRRSCLKKATSECAVVLVNGAIRRGCVEDEIANMCKSKPCEKCFGAGCNDRTLRNWCHQCTAANPLCEYKQKDTFIQPCTFSVEITNLLDLNVCYAAKRSVRINPIIIMCQ